MSTKKEQLNIYLVGGAVRDKLMGRKVSDRDYVVIGADEKTFYRYFPKAVKVGKKACVYIVGGEEYTLSRADDILEDLGMRDLTINTFAKDRDGNILSHPGAFIDLEQKVLRPVAEANFLSDPLRVFRAARFKAWFPTYKIHDSLRKVMSKVGQGNLLASIAGERVGKETLSALQGVKPGNFLKLLFDTGCLTPWLSEFEASPQIPAGPKPYHIESLFEHTVEVMNRLAGNPLEVWMGLSHDLGKTHTPKDQWPKHYGHDENGANVAKTLGTRLRLPKQYIQAGEVSAALHMKAGRYPELRSGTRVDLLVQLHRANLVNEMIGLVKADKGIDIGPELKKDLDRMLSVKLPTHEQGKGELSGARLRELRCLAIAGKGQG